MNPHPGITEYSDYL
jgi:hypothetical protein